jgi:hypothetical protein
VPTTEAADDLPYVDEHALLVERGTAETWQAVLDTLDGTTSKGATARVAKRLDGTTSKGATARVAKLLDGTTSKGATARVAKLLGCADTAAGGPRPLAAGSTIPGFRVAAAVPGRQLTLAGRHRFSRYALIFRIDELGPGQSRVLAETRAVFPGPLGRIYGGLVIGTRGHVLAVRRQLGAIKRRAELS